MILTVIPAAAAIVLAAIGLLHLYWAFGGAWGGRAAVPETLRGKPLFIPGRIATVLVSAALFAAAALIAIQADLLPRPSGSEWIAWGCRGAAAVFALRTIGDFRYVGLFKSVRSTRFARYDTRLFTPLCFLLCLAFITALIDRTGNRPL
ncbi:DUF3995 domain-containing protein [Paenibacillus kobensis]|uniref:DUF3995 domain-containing protein n=1 Tax=Paenibacillus kobensis TaxID=59841 RepID=UPI001FE7F5AF|nr:DUF3995 domain-containing protein [Paenibacillus kobensis]